MVTTVFEGVVRGKIIELDREPGLPPGKKITVTITADGQKSSGLSDAERLERFKRAAGSWSDDPEGLEEYLEWNRQQRKTNRGGTDE